MLVTRFAPSPNGPLHLGHAFSAVIAHDLARAAGGRFVLRVEDIDPGRTMAEIAEGYPHDLAWLGLDFEQTAAQSRRLASYEAAADRLRAMGLLYPCRCTRAEIAAAALEVGPEGPVYAGTCRGREIDPQGAAWRLDVASALALTGPLEWTDELAGVQQARPGLAGDPVLVRKDAPAGYHLAATLDDAADGVTLVTRGRDLFAATHVHRLLQALLGLPVPRWHHHPLLVDASGSKRAKRRGSAGLSQRREAGEDGLALAEDLRAHRFPAGISLR
jgi:glutamyl-Q tRNA(Asp) synthetase